jgi:hypothetical protein
MTPFTFRDQAQERNRKFRQCAKGVPNGIAYDPFSGPFLKYYLRPRFVSLSFLNSTLLVPY